MQSNQKGSKRSEPLDKNQGVGGKENVSSLAIINGTFSSKHQL
jgi:hypothetical protein